MVTTQYVLSGKVISVDIPDSKKELIAYKERLKTEELALQKRKLTPLTPTQKRNIDHELQKIKKELSIVNNRLIHFVENTNTKIKKRLKQYYDLVSKKGLDEFPVNSSWEEKYYWALSLVRIHQELCHGKNNTGLNNDLLLAHLSDSLYVADEWKKQIIKESEHARSELNNSNY